MRNLRPRTLQALAGLVLTLSCTALAADPTLQAEDAWTPEAPPGRMMAGFVTLHNPGEAAITVVGAHSPQFERVEVHDMTMSDGVMRMRRLDRLTIEAGATVELRPGGKHLMLMQPGQSLEAGDELEIVLELDDGDRTRFVSIVRPRRP